MIRRPCSLEKPVPRLPCLALTLLLALPAGAQPSSQRLIGEFRYLADAPSFTRCDNGERLPVAMEGDYLALERAYRGTPPGSPLTVSLQGRLLPRLSMEESQGERLSLVVDRYEGRSRDGCPGGAPLAASRWRLDELPGAESGDGPPPQTPTLAFLADGRVAGSGGCNGFTGSYRQQGQVLQLGRLASTLRACVGGGMAQEQELLKRLAAVARFERRGQELLLFDAGGALLARFTPP